MIEANQDAAQGPSGVGARPMQRLPHPAPAPFVPHVVERDFHLAVPWTAAWQWLETPETFTQGQIWPFRVEFLSADPDTPAGFYEGGFNIHHGPLLSLPGRLTEIREETANAYRRLDYLYGAYAISLRLVRPTCLEFWVESSENSAARVRLRLASHVHRRFEGLWNRSQDIFWDRFPRWMAQSLEDHAQG